MSTWAAAIASVHTQLAPLESTTVKVYGYEPGNPGWRRPLAVTCSMGPLTPTEYGVTVRVYGSTNEQIDTAQTAFTDLVIAVDELLDDLTPRSIWQTVWLADENAWMCSTVLGVGREDFQVHQEAFAYVASVVGEGVGACRVLEFGSRDINGSVRGLFHDADYTGVDVAPGDGVDVIADASEWTKSGFDVVVCCEVLEHTPKGKAIIAGARRALGKTGGTLIVTCATDPRAAHSAADGGPLQPNEFYRNVSPALMRRWLTASGFQVIDQQVHHTRGDLYVTAVV